MKTVRIHFLGSGDAFCAGGRHQAGYLVQSADHSFLLDCGATTLAALNRSGLGSCSIDTVFISHLHGDHFSGLPFLFLHYVYVEPRQRSLRIVGPPGTEERVRSLFRAMYRDSAAQPLPFNLDFVEIRPQEPFQADGLRLDPFRVPHQENEISLGFAIEVDGRRLLYSGDSGWTEVFVDRAQGVDLFVCECCFFETRVAFHLDYPRLAENRDRLAAKRVVLTHLGREVLARQDEIEMTLASDGMTVEI